MSSTENVKVNCAFDGCPLPSNFICCSVCHLVHYCSQGHQKTDWKNHKKICSSPLTLQSSAGLGRHYVASRDLEAGSLLLSEWPLLVEPVIRGFGETPADSGRELMEDINHTMVICLACSTPPEGKKCPKCDWPICSLECSEAKIHADNECPIFAKNSFKKEYMYQELLLGVYLIRGLLLKKSRPELWDQFQDLQFKSTNLPILLPLLHTFQMNFKDLAKDLGEDFANLQVLVKLCGIFLKNAFACSFFNEEKPGKKTNARILYQKSSMFSHGCFPNCSWALTYGPDFKLEIRTAIDIVKGQILSISYTPMELMVGAVSRNIQEMKGFFDYNFKFNCLCDRCLDPTELNSMISAVNCTRVDCTDGYLVPKDPKNFSTWSIWACTRCGDQSTETWKSIEKLVKRAENMTKKFTLFEPEKIEDLLIILRKYLHPNHWVIQQFCRKVMRELDDQIKSGNGNSDESVLDYLIKIARYIAQVSQLTMPGLSYYKSELQQILFQALYIKFHRISSIKNDDQMVELARESSEILNQLLKVKKMAPNSRNHGQWNSTIVDLMGKRLELDSFLDLHINNQ